MIHLENVSKVYKNGTNALNNISLDIEDGEFVYFIGETGSGKSTLVQHLNADEFDDTSHANEFVNLVALTVNA